MSNPQDPVTTSTTPLKTPLPHPTPSSVPTPATPLTPDQTLKYALLLAAAKTWTEYPSTSKPSAPPTPITPSDRQWLTRECLLRYLRATKWSVAQASQRLFGTLTWRHEYGTTTQLTPEYISVENETGKQVLFGYDHAGRPILMMNPSKQNTNTRDRQVQHLVFMLERCIDLMPPNQETLAWLINFGETRTGAGPSVAQGRSVIGILQNHYPERLGRALMINVPAWFNWMFYKPLSIFVDPITREKLKFNAKLQEHVPPEQLLVTYGGDAGFEYVHAEYWPALCRLAEERRAEMRARWERAGSRVGESEAFLRGAEGARSVGEEEGEGVVGVVEGVGKMEVKGDGEGTVDGEKKELEMDGAKGVGNGGVPASGTNSEVNGGIDEIQQVKR